ncbi:hypothetical protein GYMLUDRAFT_265663 [Collybiopsis luxurians FD-317 M1]|uniref:MYND-type domain-containing protein n=1 Tax=Collybiopsis luxurians FD-317 M1 TaxID=944289 RepID=A0A0D0C2A4_9AGAR|nr:hypothetical protein GYMLUDRAFT_265663 [Collybiopsis luxurians FD-317 M1]
MNRRIETLKKRALSGKEDSDDALEKLASILLDKKDKRTYYGLIPTLLQSLSRHTPPPSFVGQVPTIPSNGRLVFTVLKAIELITFSTLYQVRSVNSVPSPAVLHSVNTGARWRYGLLWPGIISSSDIANTPGVADVVFNLPIYALTIRSPSRPINVQDIYLVAFTLADLFDSPHSGQPDGWEDFCTRFGTQHLKVTKPKTCDGIAQVLVQLCQERALNWKALHYWLRILRWTGRSVTFVLKLVQRRAVYFLTHLLVRVSRHINSHGGAAAMKDLHVSGVWVMGVVCLEYAVRSGGFDSVILALETGLLPALWRVAVAFERYGNDDQFTAVHFYGGSLDNIAAHSMYRSVQKVLVKILHKPLFSDASVQEYLDESAELESTWRAFKEVVDRRVRLKNQFEVNSGLYYCSYPKCTTPPTSKFRRCAGCLTAFYCSVECQKTDWKEGKHKQFCVQVSRRNSEGYSRCTEDRDIEFQTWIVKAELWAIREKLLERQIAYRRQHPNERSSILVNTVDFRNMNYQDSIEALSLDEAEDYSPNVEYSGGGWRDILSDFKKLRRTDKDVGPVVVVTLPRTKVFHQVGLILRNPDDELVESRSRRGKQFVDNRAIEPKPNHIFSDPDLFAELFPESFGDYDEDDDDWLDDLLPHQGDLEAEQHEEHSPSGPKSLPSSQSIGSESAQSGVSNSRPSNRAPTSTAESLPGLRGFFNKRK